MAAASKAYRRYLTKDEWRLAPEAERALREFTEDWNDTLDPLREDLVDALRDGTLDPEETDTLRVEIEQHTRNYTSDIQTVYTDGTEQGAHAGREIAARRHQLDVAYDIVPEDVLTEFSEWSDEIVDREVMDTLTDDVTNYVRGAQKEGMSIPDIAEGINEDVFDNRLQDHVATRNARTATISSSNAGKNSTYEDANSVIGTEWIATGDNRTRATHSAAGGQITGPNTPFQVGGYTARYPADPSLPVEELVNCRCSTVPIFSDDLTDSELATVQSGGRIWH